jgi:hypothetical protein
LLLCLSCPIVGHLALATHRTAFFLQCTVLYSAPVPSVHSSHGGVRPTLTQPHPPFCLQPTLPLATNNSRHCTARLHANARRGQEPSLRTWKLHAPRTLCSVQPTLPCLPLYRCTSARWVAGFFAANVRNCASCYICNSVQKNAHTCRDRPMHPTHVCSFVVTCLRRMGGEAPTVLYSHQSMYWHATATALSLLAAAHSTRAKEYEWRVSHPHRTHTCQGIRVERVQRHAEQDLAHHHRGEKHKERANGPQTCCWSPACPAARPKDGHAHGGEGVSGIQPRKLGVAHGEVAGTIAQERLVGEQQGLQVGAECVK